MDQRCWRTKTSLDHTKKKFHPHSADSVRRPTIGFSVCAAMLLDGKAKIDEFRDTDLETKDNFFLRGIEKRRGALETIDSFKQGGPWEKLDSFGKSCFCAFHPCVERTDEAASDYFPISLMASRCINNTTSSDGCLGSNNDEGCSEV